MCAAAIFTMTGLGCTKSKSGAVPPTKGASEEPENPDRTSPELSSKNPGGDSGETPLRTAPASDNTTGTTSAEEPKFRKLTVTELIDKVGTAVVFLTARNALGDPVATGSGFVIDTEGIIATNRHVVADAASVEVQFKDETKTKVTGYLAVDQLNDLAVLTVDEVPKSVTALPLDRPESLRQGDELVAIGHPSSFKFTVTTGIVSAIRTTENLPAIYQDGLHTNPDTQWIQTNAAISGGSSGGPLFDNHGRLVGINTWIASGRSLGFAVDSTHLIDLLERRNPSTTKLPVPGSQTLATAKLQQVLEDYAREARKRRNETGLGADATERENAEPLIRQTVRQLHEIATTADVELERIEAICLALSIGGPAAAECPGFIVDMLEKNQHLVTSPHADRIPVFAGRAGYVQALNDFLQAILQRNPRPYARAQACLALINLKNRRNAASQYSAEITRLMRLIATDFKDFVSPFGVRFEKTAEDWLITFNALQPVYGRAMPLTGTDIDGKTFRLSDSRGQYTLLTFFRDADPTCRATYEELKDCQTLVENGNLVHVGVNSDESGRAKAALSDKKRVPWRSWVDPEGEITEKWQTYLLPTSFLIGPEGEISAKFIGEAGHKDIVDTIKLKLDQERDVFAGDIVSWNDEWQYAVGPLDDWTKADFDSTGWVSAPGTLGYGQPTVRNEIAEESKPVCFRRQFKVDEVPEVLMFRALFNDGIAVYLDGKELFRRNAPADPTGFALGRIPQLMVYPQVVCLDGSLVEPGKTHTLAAVVLPRSEFDSDLVFRMSVTGQLPDFRGTATHEHTPRRVHTAGLLLACMKQIPDLPELVKLYSKDKDPTVRAVATAAQAYAVDLDKPIRNAGWAFQAATRNARLRVGGELNNRAWSQVFRIGDSRDSYERGVRMARASYAMATSKDARMTVTNTLGVGMLRLGRAEEAMKHFKEVDKLDPSNINDICIGLAHHGMGEVNKAKEMLKKTKDALIETKDSYDDTVTMLNELQQLLAKPEKETKE